MTKELAAKWFQIAQCDNGDAYPERFHTARMIAAGLSSNYAVQEYLRKTGVPPAEHIAEAAYAIADALAALA